MVTLVGFRIMSEGVDNSQLAPDAKGCVSEEHVAEWFADARDQGYAFKEIEARCTNDRPRWKVSQDLDRGCAQWRSRADHEMAYNLGSLTQICGSAVGSARILEPTAP